MQRLEFPGNNIGKNLDDLGLSNEVLDAIPKSMTRE